MKKIIAIVLAVVMIAAMSVTVFAAENVISNDKPVSDKVPVTYNVSKGYTITIPSEFGLTDTDSDTDAEGSGDVVITSAKLNHGETLKVTVTSENYLESAAADWRLVDAGGADPLPYTITVTDTTADAGYTNGGISGELAHGGIVISYTSAAKAFKPLTSKMDLQTEMTNQAGDFKDNLTFTSEIVK